MVIAKFDELALKNFADVLAGILTHSKISEMLALCNIPLSEGSNKQDRIFFAFETGTCPGGSKQSRICETYEFKD